MAPIFIIQIFSAFLIPLIIFLVPSAGKRIDESPFLCGFKSLPRRIRYQTEWVLFLFLFLVFEEFILIISFIAPQSLELILFYSIIVLSALLVIK